MIPMTNLEKAKQLLEQFEVLESELDHLLSQLNKSTVTKYPLHGKLCVLKSNLETYNLLNKPYKEPK